MILEDYTDGEVLDYLFDIAGAENIADIERLLRVAKKLEQETITNALPKEQRALYIAGGE